MNREVHVRFCERFRGEIPLYLLDILSKLQLNRKFFTLLYFGLLSSTFTFAFSFLLFGSNFHVSFFQVSIVRFQFSRFQFSRFCFPSFCFPSFCFPLQFSHFCFSGFNFPASVGASVFHASALLISCGNKCLFFNGFLLRNFGFQLPLNVLALQRVWD